MENRKVPLWAVVVLIATLLTSVISTVTMSVVRVQDVQNRTMIEKLDMHIKASGAVLEDHEQRLRMIEPAVVKLQERLRIK